jgi:hypothetical protein
MTLIDSTPMVRLGAQGWTFPAWSESFYPAGMPEEWQLTFFNTQFNCVFLERGKWQQPSSEQMAQWHADTHAQFRFLLESDDAGEMPAELAEKAVPMRRSDAGIVWFDRATSLKGLAGRLATGAGAPLYVISQDGDLEQLERVATLLEVMGLAV